MIISLLSTLNNPALFNEDVFESFPSADNELKLKERYQTESRIPGEAWQPNYITSHNSFYQISSWVNWSAGTCTTESKYGYIPAPVFYICTCNWGTIGLWDRKRLKRSCLAIP